MKKTIFIFIIFLSVLNVFPKEKEYDENLNKAISFFTRNNYSKALDIFLEFKKNGYDNFENNYNIASCYYKLGKFGMSRFYYERALFFKPFDKDLFSNLKSVYEKTLKDPLIGEQEIMNKRIVYFLPLNIIVFSFLLFFVSSLLFLLLFIKLNSKKRGIMIFFIVSIIFTFIFTFFFIIQFEDYNRKIFVVSEKISEVYLIPQENETVLTTITEGIKGRILEESNDFVKISISDGSSGWIKKSNIISN
jgi:tetratricopeptide (TPR) repeat protein